MVSVSRVTLSNSFSQQYSTVRTIVVLQFSESIDWVTQRVLGQHIDYLTLVELQLHVFIVFDSFCIGHGTMPSLHDSLQEKHVNGNTIQC